MAFRNLKKRVLALLAAGDPKAALEVIETLPARQVINPLFGLLHHGDPRVRWHAVTAMGVVVARLADHEPEAARVIMRRLMWNLNDESGGIGWGSPEAMGEIMARHDRMAAEYARILISYLNPQGNYLEHEDLQAGVVWAVGRLAHARPARAKDAAPYLEALLASPRPLLRGLAAWAAAAVATPTIGKRLKALQKDETVITVYRDGHLVEQSIGSLV